jgi:hypothetical protein
MTVRILAAWTFIVLAMPLRSPLTAQESAADAKPAETKPADAKPAEAKPAGSLDDLDELVYRIALQASGGDASRARAMTAPCSGVPATEIPLPRRNSSSPSSRRTRSARSTVFVLTPRRILRREARLTT